MEIQHVSPSSWQPLLCAALFDELQPFCGIDENDGNALGVLAYLNGRRGRAILEILSVAQWKGLSNAGSFFRTLTKAWKLIHRELSTNGDVGQSRINNRSSGWGGRRDDSDEHLETESAERYDDSGGDGVNLQEFDSLLSSDCEDFTHDSNVFGHQHTCRHRGAAEPKPSTTRLGNERRTRIQLKKRKTLEKLHGPIHFTDSSGEDGDDSKTTINGKRRRRFNSPLASGLLGLPVVQEDSDGFPACWCDDGLATITEGARMNVDDIILPIIRAALPRKLKLNEDEPAVSLTLLACLIRKTLPYLSSGGDSAAVWNFVDVFLSTLGSSKICLLDQEYERAVLSLGSSSSASSTGGRESTSTVSALKRELLIRRHGVRTLISALVVRKAHQYYEMLMTSVNFLLRNLRIICQSLSAAPLALDYFEVLKTEGCMEYLLEMAADVVTGIFRLIASLVSSSNNGGASGEMVGELLEATTTLLAACKESGLDEMVRDVCIGLDLLSTIDFAASNERTSTTKSSAITRISIDDFGRIADNIEDGGGGRLPRNFGRVSESESSTIRPFLDNVYHGKLYAIMFHIVALINYLQRQASLKSHLATCSKSNHRLCCVSCRGLHHASSLESSSSTSSTAVIVSDRSDQQTSVSNKCSIAYLEKIIFLCLRNVTGVESKQMFIEALESFPSCCCVSKMHMLTVLLEELADTSSSSSATTTSLGKSSLLHCFVAKLSRESSSSCSRAPISSCRFCNRGTNDGEKRIHHRGGDERMMWSNVDNDAFVIAWSRFVERWSSKEMEETFLRLLQRVFPVLESEHREKIVYTAVIPSLIKWCREHDEYLKSTNSQLPTKSLQMFSLLVDLCETGVTSVIGYHRAGDELMEFADALFYHADTRSPFSRLARRLATIEWDVIASSSYLSSGQKAYSEAVFNRFLFNKLHVVGKLILNDTQNFVSDTAQEFWLTSAELMDTCRELLAMSNPSNHFRLIFTDFGGFTQALRILEATALSLGSKSSGSLGEKSAQRLVQLLCDTVGLCLASGVSDDKMSGVFDILLSLQHRMTSSSAADVDLPVFMAKRLMEAALRPSFVEENPNQRVRHPTDHSVSFLSSPNDEAIERICRVSDEGYDADAERSCGSKSAAEELVAIYSSEPTHQTRAQARLCTICLEFVASSIVRQQDSPSPNRDDSNAIVIRKLKWHCSTNGGASFGKLLIQEKCVDVLLKLANSADEKADAVRSATVALLFDLFRCNPQNVDLKPVLRLFNDRRGVFQDCIIDCLSDLMENVTFEPISYLKFPQLNNAQRWAEESIKRPTSSSSKRSRSSSPQKPFSTLAPTQGVVTGGGGGAAADSRKYERERKTSLSTAPSTGLSFAPLLNGLSSLFTFGGGGSSSSSSSRTQTLKKKLSIGGKDYARKDSVAEETSATSTTGPKSEAAGGASGVFALFPEAAIGFSMDGMAKCSISRGISVGVWTYLESAADESSKTKSESVLHLLTVGDDRLSCSLHLKRANSTVVIRIASGGTTVAEFTRAKFVPLEKWTHILLVVALSKVEQLTIKVFCDGSRETQWRLPWNSSDLKNAFTSFVCFGAAATSLDGGKSRGYRLGDVAGFRGELSLEHAIVLRSLGPRCVSVTDTRLRSLDGDLACFINASLLLSRRQELKIGTLMEDRLGLIEQLQKCQAFVFSTADNDRILAYAVDNTPMASSPIGPSASTTIDPQTADGGDSCRKVPFSKTIGKQTEMIMEIKYSVDEAVAALGGLKLFLFLFARAVESERSEECQAAALRLLLRMASRNPEWWRLFLNLRGYMVISRILSTQYCRRGYKLLEAIFDFALSVNVFQWTTTKNPCSSTGIDDSIDYQQSLTSATTSRGVSASPGGPEIVGLEAATIQDPFALTCFLLDPEIWRDADGLAVWQTGLEIVLRLLTEPPPIIAAFNVCQLNKAKFLKFFFYTLTERSQDNHVRLSTSVSSTVAAIARQLIGSPPNLIELTSCWDFVFLTHPASSTYLNYRIGGPSDWLDPETLSESSVRLDNYESKLGTKLRQLMSTMGKGAFIDWITNEDSYASSQIPSPAVQNRPFSLLGIHRLSVDRDHTSSSSNSDVHGSIESPDDVGQTQQQLPDLVCDIDTSATAVEMSDSMRTATQSTGLTDDEIFPVDEYVDAVSDVGGPSNGGGGRQRGGGGTSGGTAMDPPWLVESRGALLTVTCDILAYAPEALYRRVAGSVVKWEHLLVMLRRQNDIVVRTACMRALCLLLMRFNADQRVQFLKANGFALLANQLREHQCATETVDGLFSLLCGETIRIEDGVDAEYISRLGIDRFRASVVKPLLVAYQNSVDDVALFWNMTTSICRLFQYNGAIAQTMIESHLGEVLANVLLQLSLRHHGETDLSGISEGSLMIEAWRSLTSVVLHRCVTRSNVLHHQAFSELLQLIHCAAVTSMKFGIEAHTMVRKELCVLIQLSFESVRQIFDDGSSTIGSSTPLPPLLSSMSSRLSTPMASGRTTPLLFGEEATFPWNNTTSSKANSVYSTKSTLPRGSTPAPIGERRRSSLSGSFSNLKEKLLSISQGNLSQISYSDSEKLATQSEVLDRWKILVQYSTDYFMFFAAIDCFEERHLFDFLLHFAVNTLANESSIRKRGNPWQSLMWSSRAKLQQFLSHILVFILYPAERNFSKLINFGGRSSTTTSTIGPPPPILDDEKVGLWFRRRLLIAETFAHEPQAKLVLKYVLDSVPEWQSIVTAAIYELLLCDYRLTEMDATNCQKLLRLLKQLRTKSPLDEYDNADEIVHNVCLDERMSLEVYINARAKWFERMRNFSVRLRERHQHSAQVLSDDAMSITCAVVSEQNLPRKLFIQLKKQAANDLLMAEENLRMLVTDLCHPAGSCFDAPSWPPNWQLDPTEGPNRERRRLAPAHLAVAEKFVQTDNRWRLASAAEKRPLVKLLSGSAADSVAISTIAGQLLERLRIEDKIIFNCSAVVIRTSFECDGELLLGDRALYFVGESSRSSQKGLPLDSVISMNWPYHLITAVHRRYFQLIDLALEIFYADGETYLIAFETKEKRELFTNRLFAMDLPNLTTYSDHLLQTLTSWWREGNITNFQYLMQLNTLAGRTFNDLMQYPVFPFILTEYTSMTLNLNSLSVYRNLAKPIAIQDMQMESHYLHVYRSLDNDFKRNASNVAASDGMPIIGTYHYGSHYSNSGVVVHYLVRLPPFTQLVLEYQDNNFDLPDRTFHSISTAYRLSTSESTTDFKELIPEFFFLSEFLTNREGLNLGHRQNGQSISDVELPPWCPDSDARLFILIHRQALESANVSAHLHEWIDLIFGYKQTGQAAIDAINVFHPATYHGTLAAAADSDEIGLKALNTMVKTYGQMPRQLFRTPHLPHLIAQNYLVATNRQQQSPLLSVNGIRWGHYVGSPDLPEPSLVLKQRNHGYSNVKPVGLSALADGSCVGYPAQSMPLVVYGSVKKDLWLANVREVERIFVLCWEFGDKVVRLRCVFPPDTSGSSWTNVIALHNDVITSYASSPGSPMVFFGLKTGIVQIYKIDVASEGLKSCALVRSLYGHNGSTTAIDVCTEYSVFITGSETGECFVWDYNRLNFVLALKQHEGPVTHVCVSKTTSEVVTVALKGWGSELVLHTINGRVIGTIETDIVITSVTMSAASEGTAVNCIAAGMQNGLIRLWNTWTLAPIREICHTHFLEPIISLSYSHNSLKLYACTKSGAVLCWDSGASKQMRPPRFFCLNVA